MEKEAVISHWTLIVDAVLTAEEKVSQTLQKAGRMTRQEYCRAVAIEILSHTDNFEELYK